MTETLSIEVIREDVVEAQEINMLSWDRENLYSFVLADILNALLKMEEGQVMKIRRGDLEMKSDGGESPQ
jgi:hypothetical protein